MSGGVDSSVAAFLTKEEGYECIGATMKLFDGDNGEKEQEKTCCSLNDTEDAKSVCYRLGIEHYVFNFKDDFKEKVIDRFVSAYENGRTPNPLYPWAFIFSSACLTLIVSLRQATSALGVSRNRTLVFSISKLY